MTYTAPKALVFDMDGLLLDTERRGLESYLHACRVLGAQANVDVYRRCIGANGKLARRILADGHGEDFPVDAFDVAWSAHFRSSVRTRPPDVKEGARELLATARRAGLPCALATSSSEPGVGELLDAVGLAACFAIRVTGDRVTNGKPHPETYRTAAAELGVVPAQAWALEDSANGVRSAFAAGFAVLQIPDLVPPDGELRALGHAVLPSLRAVDALLRRLL